MAKENNKKAVKKTAAKKAARSKASRGSVKTGRDSVFALRITDSQHEAIESVPRAQAAVLLEIACKTYNDAHTNLMEILPETLAGKETKEPSRQRKLESLRFCATELGISTVESFLKIQSEVEAETGVSFPIATLASIASNAIDPENLRSLVLSLADEAAKVDAS